ncbi:MAG: hypothetical protein ACREJ0_05465 [Geminicoccaceae bacterium]
MSVTKLREVCARHSIRNIAVIDDVFDTPDPGKLDRVHYRAFVETLNANPTLVH